MGLSLAQFWGAYGISGGGLNTPNTPLGTPLVVDTEQTGRVYKINGAKHRRSVP